MKKLHLLWSLGKGALVATITKLLQNNNKTIFSVDEDGPLKPRVKILIAISFKIENSG